ncbi:OmpP1/FadL family transporter [Helicobacter pametensis]|uniref:OmpP1/FadL family transporter n=1 Tax=Helicobacter pametensis TaxID=95149 RepID=UPI000489854B|nr:outer membrane protein transport protein [Helicobacter pametensis]
MKKHLVVVTLGAYSLYGAGFKLNEHSLNSIALSSAYVAGANGADSALYNPANMGMGKFANKHEIEVSVTWLNVPSFDFTTDFTKVKNEIGRDQGTQVSCKPNSVLGSLTCVGVDLFAPGAPQGVPKADGHAKATNFAYPEIFYKSPTFYGFNVGLSVTAPSGMTIDWDGEGGKFLDNSFIAMVEANPVISFKFAEWFSIGGGGRVLYGMGKFKNSLYVPYEQSMQIGTPGFTAIVTSKGTTAVDQISDTKGWGYGWNAALTLKPLYFWNKGLSISATYRSPAHINFEGTLKAKARTGSADKPMVTADMDADLTLSTDLPPVMQIGVAQQIGKFLVEFVYERNFWSYGDKFEFNYKNQKFSNIAGSQAGQLGSTPEQQEQAMHNMMSGADYDAVAIGRGWQDTNSYRLGVTYGVGQKLRLMASVAYDETPVPSDAFGIPDADGYMVGVGARYSMFDDTLDVGAAYSMTFKDNRKSAVQSHDGWGKLQLVNVSMACRF